MRVSIEQFAENVREWERQDPVLKTGIMEVYTRTLDTLEASSKKLSEMEEIGMAPTILQENMEDVIHLLKLIRGKI